MQIKRQPPRKKKETVKQEDFIFCYDKQKSPTVLVMLRSVDHILKALLTDIEEPYYFWIHKNQIQMKQIIEAAPQQVRLRSQLFQTYEQMKQEATKKQKYKKIILICQSSNTGYILDMSRNFKYLGIIEIANVPMEEQIEQQQNVNQSTVFEKQNCSEISIQEIKQIQQKMKKKSENNSKIMKCKNQREVNYALIYNKWNFSDVKSFPNFVVYQKEVDKSHYMVQNMIAMLRTEFDKKTRTRVVECLENVTLQLQKFHSRLKYRQEDLRQAFQELKKGELTAQRAIQVYTSQDYCFYVLINSFMRAMSCPTELFYIQPFFVNLYRAIKQRNKKIQKQRFICYRGAAITTQQIEAMIGSIGQIVQNLGFLSASKIQQAAYQFRKNIMYQIKIQNQINPSLTHNYGYAQISQSSNFSYEQQIIFNPLNYFKILEISQHSLKSIKSKKTKQEQEQVCYRIVLNFGEVTRIFLEHDQDKLDQREKIIREVIKNHDRTQQIIMNQGIALIKNGREELKVAEIYWKKYLSLFDEGCLDSEKSRQKTNGIFLLQSYFSALNSMSMLMYQQGNIEESNIYSSRCLDFAQKYLRDHCYYFFAVINTCVSYRLINKTQTAQQILKSTLKKLLTSQQNKQIKILLQIQLNDHLSQILISNNKIQQALKIIDECLKIKILKYGKRSCNYSLTLNIKAHALSKAGKHQEALKIYFQNLVVEFWLYGENRFQYLTKLQNTATCFFQLFRIQEALALIQKCIYLKKKILGPRHPSYIKSLRAKARMLLKLFYYEEAEIILKECENLIQHLSEQSKVLDYSEILNDMGVIYYKKKLYLEALTIYKKSLQILKQMTKSNTLNYINSLSSIAAVLQQLHQKQQSIKAIKQCEKILSQKRYQDCQQLIIVYNKIGVSLFKLQKFQQAMAYFRKCQIFSMSTSGPRNRTNFHYCYSVMLSLFENGQQVQALALAKVYQTKTLHFLGEKSIENLKANVFILNTNLCLGFYQQAKIICLLIYGSQNSYFSNFILSMMFEKVLKFRKSLLYSQNSIKACKVDKKVAIKQNTKIQKKLEVQNKKIKSRRNFLNFQT